MPHVLTTMPLRTCEVLQGSIPLLFLMYFNDITEDLQTGSFLFAVDTAQSKALTSDNTKN